MKYWELFDISGPYGQILLEAIYGLALTPPGFYDN
jgi:hypothetical protein